MSCLLQVLDAQKEASRILFFSVNLFSDLNAPDRPYDHVIVDVHESPTDADVPQLSFPAASPTGAEPATAVESG
jgi:hypothetical protein